MIIDLEICPKCCEVRMIYFCPKEDCKKKEWLQSQCKGCRLCIPRCKTVEIFCVFKVGYSFLSVISVTNHIVSSTQIAGALLQTLVSSVKFVMKILMDIPTMMFYNDK